MSKRKGKAPPIEDKVEDRFRRGCNNLGVKSRKMNTLGVRGESGWTDRLVLAPYNRMFWCEIKREPGWSRVEKSQKKMMPILRMLGCRVIVLNGDAECRAWLHLLSCTLPEGWKEYVDAQVQRPAP